MEKIFSRILEMDRARSPDERMNGHIFKVLFLTEHALIEELFSAINIDLKLQSFRDAYMQKLKKSLSIKRDALLLDIEKCEAAGKSSEFYQAQLSPVDRQLALQTVDDYIKFLLNQEEGHPAIIGILVNDCIYLNRNNGSSDTGFIQQNYPLYDIGKFLYEMYVAKVSLFEKFEIEENSELLSFYRDHGIDLRVNDSQFSKYGLLSFGDGFRIINNKEAQSIKDERFGLNLGIQVPSDLLSAIEVAIAEGLIKEISFKIDSMSFDNPSFEGVQYGSLFSFEALQLPDVSKLYDDEYYEDNLWIKVDRAKSSMTFEELCGDFAELDGMVITQIVHLELFQNEDRWIISHIDHEYILYSLDEYADRLTDPNIKGFKKLKTFKIDKANIPLDYRFHGRYFLFQVLDAYFCNKPLIREYFSSL